MNVNSIKINNVYHNGEVDLDHELPEAVDGLDTIKSLDENKEVLGAKNLLDDLHPKELINMEQIGNLFKNTEAKQRRQDIDLKYYKSDGTSFSGKKYRNVLSDGHHKLYITIGSDEISCISLRFLGFDIKFGSYTINFNWNNFNKPGQYWLLYDVISNIGNEIGGFEIGNFMITLEAETNPTYRPYAMSNQELTQRLLSLEQRVAALEG